jgi:tetratricopeptide (TPR) repeat protein
VSESLNQQIDRLQEIYKSEKDPQGRAFVPLAEAHRRLGDLGKALAVLQEGLAAHPDFASAHMVAGWVHRSRKEPDDAMRSFERVLELDAENVLARAAIAELLNDQQAQAYRDKMAGKKAAEHAAAATADDERPVAPIASLAPDATTTTPVAAPESVSDGVDRPVVPIGSLAPGEPEETIAAAGPLPNGAGRPVVSVLSLAPDGDGVAGRRIYTKTLAELYAGQDATDKAIEVYRKLISDDPDDAALSIRMAELESLDPGSHGVSGERQTVPIELLAPDGNAENETPDDPFLR